MTNVLKIISIIQKCIAFVALATAGTCFSQVYKCISRSGNIEFSNTACAKGTSGGQVRVETNNMDMSGSREQILKAENDELRQQLQKQSRNANHGGTNRTGRTEADLQAERASSYECTTAKKKYEWETSAGMNGKWRDASAQRLSMYSACGMREPAHMGTVPPLAVSPAPGVITHCDESVCYSSTGAVIPRVGR